MSQPTKPVRDGLRFDRRLFLGGSAALAGVAWAAPALARSEKTGGPSAEVGDLEAVKALVSRQFPGREGDFTFSLVPRTGARDHFEFMSEGGRVQVKGSTALALCSGLHWYVKHHADRHWSWCGTNWELPDELPAAPLTRIETPYLHNGYFNYCTYNYTMSWWDWPRWERELDFMAMNGVTFPLAITGVENVWRNFLLRLGYSREQTRAFICGPAYFAWWLMGNLEGFGGPLPESWFESHLELGRKITARMRDFGMSPMLQGFVGLVPTTLAARRPGARIIPQGKWCEDFERPAVLDPTDPLFPELASIWYEELFKCFGQTRFFAGDLFHEGGKTGGADVAAAARAVYGAMEQASPGAVWVLQGWGGNPKREMMKGLEIGQALILDLAADENPRYWKRNGWGGHPWVWNTIVNFGGNPGVFGRLPIEAREPPKLLDLPWLSKNLTGLGTTPEAIDQNPVVWDLHFDMYWRREAPDLDQWIANYAHRRYGMDHPDARAAWKVLLHTAYNSGRRRSQRSLICTRPSTMTALAVSLPNKNSGATYDHGRFVEAVDLMHRAAAELAGRDAFDYDLVDVTRQLLSNLAFPVMARVRRAFLRRDHAAYDEWSERMIDLIVDLDALLETRREFMLGAWIADARARGATPEESDLYEWNARNLVTCWTYRRGQLNDYSRREWSGLLKDYYLPRWRAFLDYHRALLEGKDAAAPDYFEQIEKPFADRREPYPAAPTGPAAEAATTAYTRYGTLISQFNIY